jgi:hypothetical protein
MKAKPVILACLVFAIVDAATTAKGAINWVRHAFPLPESIWSVDALDATADQNLDLVAMGETKIFALIAPQWKTSLLADTKEPKMLYCVALDADRDGDLDIAVARYQVPWIIHRQAVEAGKPATEPKVRTSALRGWKIFSRSDRNGASTSLTANSTAFTACGRGM